MGATDVRIRNHCPSNAAMQCIGQTYTITLGMVSVVDVDVDVRQCVGIGKFTKFSNGRISKSCSPIDMKFKHRLLTMKETSWVVQGSKISIQDGGSRHLGFLDKS